VRIGAGDVDQTLAGIEATWQRVFPSWPLQYQFADQSFDAAYRAEQQLSRLFGVFAGLAIVIACLGLFGLAAYAAQQRTKEIGIRKAVGASVTQIVGLLTKDFALLVVGAIVVAVPVAYVGLNRWLETFAYHVDLGATVFVLAGGGALLVAVLTVAVHAFRAARVDPATTLRSE
jgi:putative ABC transport system permease protein